MRARFVVANVMGMFLLWAWAGCNGTPAGLADNSLPDGVLGETPVDPNVVADELIIAPTPGTTPQELETLLSESQADIRDDASEESGTVLVGFDPADREEVRETLENSPLVEEVIDNQIIFVDDEPSDPSFGEQWHLELIDAPGAWEITTGSSSIPVAVLDTGVDRMHEDLAAKLTAGGNTYGDGGGTDDTVGHGTAVAGIIGAISDNEVGITGITWQNPIIPIRVTNDAGQTTSWAIRAGIALAVQQRAKVINISFSPLYNNTPVLRQARLARLAGSLVVISSDNAGERVTAPASADAMFVAAIDRADELARFSTYGDLLDLVAPGVAILTTQREGKYAKWSGTSFSAPMVSAVAALVWSIRPGLRPEEVREVLKDSARDLGAPGEDDLFGAGCVDARAAVERARDLELTVDRQSPAVGVYSPADGDRVRGRITMRVGASDNTDVARVELSVDGQLLGRDAIAPYAFTLDTAVWPTGAHELRAAAVDVYGNAATNTVTIYFQATDDTQPPSVQILYPHAHTTVRGVVTILANVSDNAALDRAEVFIDDQRIAEIPLLADVVAANWDASAPGVTPGPHAIRVRVYDSGGLYTDAEIDVTSSQ